MVRSIENLTPEEKRDLVNVIADKKRGQIDIDWADLCNQFALDINPETLRKAGVGIKMAMDAKMLGACSEFIYDNGYLERQKMRDISRQVNTALRTESRSELLRETVREAIQGLPHLQITSPSHPVDHNGHRSLVLCIGDFHYGADIHVKGLLGETINEYNSKVFEDRMERLLREVREVIDAEAVDNIHVFLVGDLIDGMLRQSQLMRLQYGMIESTIRLSEYLAVWLNELSQYACVHVHGVTGNHSEVRPLRSKAGEFEDENLEKIIMWYLAARFDGNEYVQVDAECNKFSYAKIEGFTFVMVHGSDEKNITNFAKECVNLYSKQVDFFICGHKHKEQEYPMGLTDSGNSVVIRTPSLCGVDHYAQSRGYGGRPGALLMVIERDYGRRCVYPIQL